MLVIRSLYYVSCKVDLDSRWILNFIQMYEGAEKFGSFLDNFNSFDFLRYTMKKENVITFQIEKCLNILVLEYNN